MNLQFIFDFFISIFLLFLIEHSPLKPRINSSDFVLFKYRQIILRYRRRFMDSIAIMENVIIRVYTRGWFKFRPGQTFVDIGGHIGTFSIPVTKQSPGSHCFTYEPASPTRKILLENIKLNNLQKQITVFDYAVSGNRQPKILRYHHLNPGANSFVLNNSHYRSGISVKSTTLDDIFNHNRIKTCDLLKLDCEGAELDILTSASPGTLAKVKNICLEFHLGPKEKQIILNLLHKNGFTTWEIPGRNPLLRPFFGIVLIFGKKD